MSKVRVIATDRMDKLRLSGSFDYKMVAGVNKQKVEDAPGKRYPSDYTHKLLFQTNPSKKLCKKFLFYSEKSRLFGSTLKVIEYDLPEMQRCRSKQDLLC